MEKKMDPKEVNKETERLLKEFEGLNSQIEQMKRKMDEVYKAAGMTVEEAQDYIKKQPEELVKDLQAKLNIDLARIQEDVRKQNTKEVTIGKGKKLI